MPRRGGTLNVRIQVDPFDWDVTMVGVSNPNDQGFGLAYNSLLGVKAGPEVKYTELVLQPELAERWAVSPDAKTFTFSGYSSADVLHVAPIRESASAQLLAGGRAVPHRKKLAGQVTRRLRASH